LDIIIPFNTTFGDEVKPELVAEIHIPINVSPITSHDPHFEPWTTAERWRRHSSCN